MAEDDDLLAGVARGDPDWPEIYRAYSKEVHAAAQQFFRSVGRAVDSKDVDDIMQLTFEEALKGGVLTPDTRSIVAKLRTVARRRAHDAVRRGAKVHNTPIDDMAGDDFAADDAIEDLVEANFELKIRRAVWRNQRRLSSQERIVFRARTVDGLKLHEIAARIHLTPQRVGQIHKEAMRKILQGIDLTGDGGDVI